MSLSKTPTFNLKAVLKETGIAADTLRAWERRYGLPKPERTPGGHRLYSHYNIETIKWLIARQTEGLSISRAVGLWNEQLASGSDPLADAAAASLSLAPAATPNSGLEARRREWIAACFQYDTASAEQILNQAFATHSIEIACTEILLRGLYEIGEYWHQGAASVQQEHLASELATRRLETLLSATPPPTRDETILLVCPPNEWHAFPLLLTSLLLRRRGWNAIHLGANVPTDRIEETLKSVKPNLAILAAQTLVNAVQLREMARVLNQKGIPTAFGGRVFNNINTLSARIPAHFLGNTIEYSIPVVEGLVSNPQPAPSEESPKKSSLQAALAFQQSRFQIESAPAGIIESGGRAIEFLDVANRFLGDSLVAALELGDIAYLSTDIMWISDLLAGYQIPVSVLPAYLAAYAQSVDKIMKGEGKEISDWLKLKSAELGA
jgi:DNA-binding transcriptional MerR regulator